ncbi:MarR family transcriptional regulator [Candidatus Woesearchaeota archaeon]|nr:MarR family transcriptional regulator [Candidatus Woesearchaeota archaeon]
MINICKLELTTLQQEILRLSFIKAGTSLNQRQVANLLEVTPPAVMKALPTLEKKGLIKIEQDKETKRWAIQLNRDDQRVMQLKRADNLQQIYETGLVGALEKEFAGATILLFGSYSRGDDIINSDIDIAIIGRKEKAVDLSEYEKALERKIILNIYASFKNIHKHLQENLYNGIVLIGGIEL